MTYKMYQADAFASEVFTGNPAAIVPLTNWLPDNIMQQIAMENNLSETAFYIPDGDQFQIRWFTPGAEVDLCGHATLAAAFILFECEGYTGNSIRFCSPRSGLLLVEKQHDQLLMNFPADIVAEVELNTLLQSCIKNQRPAKAYKGKTDYLLVFETEEAIRAAIPDMQAIEQLPARGLIITAPGNEVHFVSRFFAPQVGVPEDPVTGSAHTTLFPFWLEKLTGKVQEGSFLTARQLSARGGSLQGRQTGDRVELAGRAVLYMEAQIQVPD